MSFTFTQQLEILEDFREAADALGDTAQDVIADFEQGYDKIDLTGLGFIDVISGSGSGSTLGFSVLGGNTIIVDDDSDFSIQLAGSYTLTAADFIFA